MTIETAAADVTAGNVDISDEKLDQFFSTGGKDLGLPEETNEISTDETQTNDAGNQAKTDAESAQAAKKDDSDLASKLENYKGMAHEERERRKEIQRRLEENENKAARLETAFQKIIERFAQPQQQVPNFEDDPIEALKYNQDQLQKKLEQTSHALTQKQQQEHYQAQVQGFVKQYQTSANEFAKNQTDFKEAYSYLIKQRGEEYLAAGYNTQEAERLLVEDEMAIVAKAYSEGANPAERIYNLAKVRGYNVASAQQAAQPNNQKAANEQKLATMEKGLQASKSLNNVAGSGGKPELTLETLANMMDDMTDEELDKAWHKLLKAGN